MTGAESSSSCTSEHDAESNTLPPGSARHPRQRAFLVDADVTGALAELLGRGLAVYPGSVRIWWPGVPSRSDPGAHPVVMAVEGESEQNILAEVARQLDLTRPHVRREIRLSEEARALAEQERKEAVKAQRNTAERLREAHAERHREVQRAEAAEARAETAEAKLAAFVGEQETP